MADIENEYCETENEDFEIYLGELEGQINELKGKVDNFQAFISKMAYLKAFVENFNPSSPTNFEIE